MENISDLIKESEKLQLLYVHHFKTEFPNRIAWWDPREISSYPEELRLGVQQMRIDVKNAIKNNEPIQEMSKEEWDMIVF